MKVATLLSSIGAAHRGAGRGPGRAGRRGPGIWAPARRPRRRGGPGRGGRGLGPRRDRRLRRGRGRLRGPLRCGCGLRRGGCRNAIVARSQGPRTRDKSLTERGGKPEAPQEPKTLKSTRLVQEKCSLPSCYPKYKITEAARCLTFRIITVNMNSDAPSVIPSSPPL